MLDLIDAEGSYSPETIAVMTVALDIACQYAANTIDRDEEDVRKKLALLILRHVQAGESDPARLAVLASSELIAGTRRK